MKNPFLKISTFLLGTTTCLALTTGCQSPISASRTKPLEETATPSSAIETPFLTPLPPPEPQVNTNSADNPDDLFPYEPVDDFSQAISEKLSGITFYPPRATLFAVTDNGRIIELKTDGTLIQNKLIRKKADFEGITYNPATAMLYVAVEAEEIILEVNPETVEAERDIPINRMFEGNLLLSPEGNGVEGITFVPADDGASNGSFYLVNQSNELGGTDPSIVFEVEINHTTSKPQAQIVRYFSVGVTDLSGIHYVPSHGHLLIISDTNNLLLEVSLTGQVLATYPLPGDKQEGITTAEDGSLYIAQDKKEALLKFTPIDNPNLLTP